MRCEISPLKRGNCSLGGSQEDLLKFASDSFWEGFLGAGLFARLGLPGKSQEAPESKRYAFALSVCSLINLAAMFLGFFVLRRSGHGMVSYRILAFAMLWLTAEFLHSRNRRLRA